MLQVRREPRHIEQWMRCAVLRQSIAIARKQLRPLRRLFGASMVSRMMQTHHIVDAYVHVSVPEAIKKQFAQGRRFVIATESAQQAHEIARRLTVKLSPRREAVA